MRRGTAVRAIALLGSGALLLGACGGDDEGGDIATGVGVTSEPCPDAVNEDNGCIYLGIISDLSEGPFASFAVELVEGHQDFWTRVNEQGGIDGYDVNVTEYTRDNKYDPQTHAQVYREIEPDVLALAQTLGTPTTQAILEDMDADDVVGAPASWWSGWQFEETDFGVILESGHSYCIESQLGLDWFAENNSEPAKVGAVGYPGDFGGDFAAGVEAWAGANGAEYTGFVETGPNAVVGNQDAAVKQVVASGAEVIGIGAGPAETAEIVGKAVAAGYTGQFLGAAPSWNPALLGTAAAPALEAAYTNIATHESYNGTSEAHQAMQEARGEDNPPANDGYTFGWVWQYPLKAALEAATDNGDLTRAGLRSVIDGLEVDYEGALPTVTLGGDPNENADRSGTVNQVDPDDPLGITALEVGVTTPTADAYEYTAPCSATG